MPSCFKISHLQMYIGINSYLLASVGFIRELIIFYLPGKTEHSHCEILKLDLSYIHKVNDSQFEYLIPEL